VSAPAFHFPQLLSDGDADAMIALCERFGSYGMYGQKPIEDELGRGLFQRHDAAMNYVRTGGRFGRQESFAQAAVRTNYFRETYAYAEPVVPGIETFLRHEGFADAARELFDRPIVQPAIVYANLLVPGQELAVHTDVPEFRGVNRTKDPEWLMVVMHHSGLFDRWRIPIATGVAWFHGCRGGDFAFYPDGFLGPSTTVAADHNTAVVLDTDSVFHGVDPVGRDAPLAPLRPGMQLVFDGAGRWSIRDGDAIVASYAWDELRLSISWKAYCFADDAERQTWQQHSDDLALDTILDRLVDDLRARGRVRGDRPAPTDLALQIIDEYIKFPAPPPH